VKEVKMLSEKEYVQLSLESNLFFLRIAKEHAIFAAASLPPRDEVVVNQLMVVKCKFEKLLNRAIDLADGIISMEVLTSGELVTDLTLSAENVTQQLTGLPIDTNITKRELRLSGNMRFMQRIDLYAQVQELNQQAIGLMQLTIDFKNKLLHNILNCRAFSYTYPTMLHHVIMESEFYLMLLKKLESKESPFDSIEEMIELEIQWNHLMSEHTKFIRGYLDPEEVQLFKQANIFSEEFDKLEEKTKVLTEKPELLPVITRESEALVTNLRNFKRQGTEGLLACKVKAIMVPLLADHVTREANHYLRLLKLVK
jgi:hypothetical protein